MDFIIAIFVLLSASVLTIIDHIKKNKEKKQIRFDEFDNIEKIKSQRIKNIKELEHESNIMNNAFNSSYLNAITDTMLEKNGEQITDFDRLNARNEAIQHMEDVDEALYKNKTHNVREEIITEGSEKVELKENGYNIDIELFKRWSIQIFTCIKIGTDEQLNVVKNFISSNLYNKLNKQKRMFERDGLEFITEDLFIEKCSLLDYSRSMSKEEIKILIVASMREYILQKSTNDILRGDYNRSYQKRIIMTFLKKNITEDEGFIHNCPNCGAAVSQTELGKCRYCGTLIFPIRYNWTLTKFETF